MSAFRFPQPGEQQNAVAIPVPIHTLRALLAAALAWEIDTGVAFPGIVPPQIRDATNWALCELSETDSAAATRVAERLMQERNDAEDGR